MSEARARPDEGTALDALRTRLGARAAHARLRRATIVDLAHTFEDLVEEFDLPGFVVTGFETPASWEQARDRYRELAAHDGRRVAVIGHHHLDAQPPVEALPVPADHLFADQRLLLALTPVVSATLLAKAVPADPGDDGDEQPFEVLWTFDPLVAQEAWGLLRDCSTNGSSQVAELAEAALSTTFDPMAHTFGERYAVALLERLESTRRRWRDLSVELLGAQRQLEERGERQVKLERLASIGTLAASVAHELNNPLASITMAAGLMGQLDDLDERERIAGIIEAEALRAGRIASDLLSYVADRELELSPTRLDEWLEELASSYRTSGRPVAVAPAPPIEVAVDRDRLRQAITNLIDNALAAIAPDGHVELDLAVTDDHLRIGVTDDGVGIPQTVRSRLFDPFVTSKPRGQGTGLGLPIARAHLQDHGGDVELERTGPDGTRFVVVLPREGVPARDAGEDESAQHEVAGSDPVTGGRVLVVDDEPPIRSLLETLLVRHGWEVTSASGLREALEAVQAMPVDAALIDVQLGIDDGPKVLRELESIQHDIRRRTAYITGAAPESGQLGGRPVLAKPFSWAELAALLEQLSW